MLLRVLMCALSLAFAAGAAAQAYRWIDKDGKVRYGDTPPPGVKASPLKLPQGGGADVAPARRGGGEGREERPADAGRAGAGVPQAPGRRAEGRRQGRAGAARTPRPSRQLQRAPGKRCATLESGQRVSRTDAKGERYYLDDDADREAESRAGRAQDRASWLQLSRVSAAP